MIAIVDYDIGNVAAVANMLARVGLRSTITADAEQIAAASGIILPGNGAFDACMRGLRRSGLLPVLEDCVLKRGRPLLGICVGAQMLGHGSDEGREPGLGWLDLRVRRFPAGLGLPVPHMGWRRVHKLRAHRLTDDVGEDSRYYFVHSYYLDAAHPGDVLLQAEYGMRFAAAVARDNVAGVQFHPEKSHRFGKVLLQHFGEQCQ